MTEVAYSLPAEAVMVVLDRVRALICFVPERRVFHGFYPLVINPSRAFTVSEPEALRTAK